MTMRIVDRRRVDDADLADERDGEAEASAEASTSTSVLPSRTAPIIFSGEDRTRLTRRARGLPSCSRACMRAREAAVSAVSLPLKNADSATRTRIAASVTPMARDMGFMVSRIEAGLRRRPS